MQASPPPSAAVPAPVSVWDFCECDKSVCVDRLFAFCVLAGSVTCDTRLGPSGIPCSLAHPGAVFALSVNNRASVLRMLLRCVTLQEAAVSGGILAAAPGQPRGPAVGCVYGVLNAPRL